MKTKDGAVDDLRLTLRDLPAACETGDPEAIWHRVEDDPPKITPFRVLAYDPFWGIQTSKRICWCISQYVWTDDQGHPVTTPNSWTPIPLGE